MAIATFGAGCFWGVEAAFMKLEGVKTTVGYMGGTKEKPTYEDVCTGNTGHAEVVQVEYDPERVSYAELLGVFWNCHDPTQKDRQGPDAGKQYRSVIFYHTEEQRKMAEESKAEQMKRRKITTEILPASKFWKAEEYHQKYHLKHGGVC